MKRNFAIVFAYVRATLLAFRYPIFIRHIKDGRTVFIGVGRESKDSSLVRIAATIDKILYIEQDYDVYVGDKSIETGRNQNWTHKIKLRTLLFFLIFLGLPILQAIIKNRFGVDTPFVLIASLIGACWLIGLRGGGGFFYLDKPKD